MKKLHASFITGFLIISLILNAQTDYTGKIINPGFETGNYTGWTWTGRAASGGWTTVNTDGDATKNGQYIAGYWNSTIGDVECSQIVTGLPNGNYLLTALATISANRTTNQRLFANNKSQLFGVSTHPAYTAANLAILGATETYTFGGYAESSVENGPFQKLSVLQKVTDGSLSIGFRFSGKINTKGYTFTYTTKTDAGFFKFDHFTLTEVSDMARLDNISLNAGFLNTTFNPEVFTYSATIPQGVISVTPSVKPTVEGTTISGAETVDLSSGSGVSNIIVTALDGVTTKTYTINYKVVSLTPGTQQEKLYQNNFPLGDVVLLDGPFKHAHELDVQTLLKYDVNRLLAPYRKEAGLPAKAISYPNWDGLDGHIGGHYLSALAMNYAATGDTTCKKRMDYMVSELKACQDANAVKYPSWAVGYAGGVPAGNAVWSAFKTANFTNFNAAWVPWYNLHKTYAGLRDAWLYGESLLAKMVFLDFCNWGINECSALTDAQMESMLGTEHGGMNEIFADAYQMTADAKYLAAAKRFSHKYLLNSMAAGTDNLDNLHANTQVPKAVGFQRIAEVSKDAAYIKAGQFFWQTVTANRTLASGGNSRKEYFPQASACIDYINNVEGPESCNTNNMLKLTEDLFRINPQAKYADYYERALFNHILSTQHPEHGGFVYFTPARPRHYRVYSAPNQAMWCCVGTGMENHVKYGSFIYTHHHDSLYLNLFMASELNWKEKGLKIRQETNFPEEERTMLRINAETPVTFTLMVRSPKWVKAGKLKIVVNNDTLPVLSVPQSYIAINRQWNKGDSVKIFLPMENTLEQLPNVNSYVALMHGPVLLGAKTGTENLTGLIADDSRWGHIANGPLQTLDKAPVIVSERTAITSKIQSVPGKPLTFTAPALFVNKADSALVLEPFYKIHDARYMMYWLTLTESQYKQVMDSLAIVQKTALELELRTIDKVAPGEQQPEVDHKLLSLNSYTGNYQNEFWRDARSGGFISYSLLTKKKSGLSLMVRYWGNESGSRNFNIFVDDSLIVTENVVGKWNKNEFVNIEYQIPDKFTSGKDTIRVKFQGVNTAQTVGGLFYVRLLQPLNGTDVPVLQNENKKWKVFSEHNEIIISGLYEPTSVYVYDINGQMLTSRQTNQGKIKIPLQTPGIKIVGLVSGKYSGVYKIVTD